MSKDYKKQKNKSSKSKNVVQKTDSKVIDINKNKKYPPYKPGESRLDVESICLLIDSEGKIPKNHHRTLLSTLNKISKDLLGEGAFIIDDFKLSKKRGFIDEYVLTLTLNKTNTATETEIISFLKFNNLSFTKNIRNSKKNFKLDVELPPMFHLDPKHIEKLPYGSIGEFINHFSGKLFKDIVSAPMINGTYFLEANYKKEIQEFAREKDLDVEILGDLLQQLMDKIQNRSNRGSQDIILKAAEINKIRNNDKEIQQALKSKKYEVLYHSLFPGALISWEVFDQLIKDKVNLYSITEDFRYRTISSSIDEDLRAQKLEMQGRLLLFEGKLNEAGELFEKAYEIFPERYDFEQNDSEVPIGGLFFMALGREAGRIKDWTESIKFYEKSLNYLDIFGIWEIDKLKSDCNYQIKIMQEILINNEKIRTIENQQRVISLESRMRKLVAQYSHTLGNTLFPENIYKVAEVLKKNADFRNESLILKKQYHAEVLVKHQAEMLRIKHGSDTGEEFQRLILKDRLQEESKEDSVNIIEILDYSAGRVIERLLNQNYLKIKDVRAKLVKKSGMDIDELSNDFENKVFFDQKQTSLNWINDNLAKLKIGEMSSTWEKILIRKDGYTHALLQGHWGEILFNAFKYSDHTKNNLLTIKFDEQVDEEYTWLQMIWENPCKKINKKNSGEGIEGIAEDLMLLNKTKDEKFSLYSNNKKNTFQVNLFYRSDMLISPGDDLDLVENYFD
jgi:hypothetical protein